MPNRVPPAITGQPIAGAQTPRRRGRPPKIKREEVFTTEQLVGLIDGAVIVNDGQKNVLIDTQNIDINDSPDSQQTGGAVKPRRKFPHHCDWPGCERSFRRYFHFFSEIIVFFINEIFQKFNNCFKKKYQSINRYFFNKFIINICLSFYNPFKKA